MELGLGTVLTQEVSSPLRRVVPAQLFVLPCSFAIKPGLNLRMQEEQVPLSQPLQGPTDVQREPKCSFLKKKKF